MTRGVDLSGELRDLADAVAQLEDQLETAVERATKAEELVERLRAELEYAESALIFAEADTEVLELLADFKRGLIEKDELLERTVGRS